MSVASVCLHECMVCVVDFCVYMHTCFCIKKKCVQVTNVHTMCLHMNVYICLSILVLCLCFVMYNLVKFLKVWFPLILLFYR